MKRRGVIAGGVAAAVVAAGVWRLGLLRQYPPTPYDDLLEQLTERDQAIVLGKRVADAPDARTLADELRGHIEPEGLGAAVRGDIAAGRMSEVAGWIVPRSVAQMAALAAKA
jgi:hypothetical protein